MGQAAIVVVDDTEYVREVIESMHDRNDYAVYSFANPNDALAVSENIQIDLFIFDMVMPKMNGMEVLKRLNVHENLFEVIMITGKSDGEDSAEAMRLGAFGVLQKPFSHGELITSVEYALASAAAKKQRVGNRLDLGHGNNSEALL